MLLQKPPSGTCALAVPEYSGACDCEEGNPAGVATHSLRMAMAPRPLLLLSLALCGAAFSLGPLACAADDASTKTDPRYPFRTDFANAHLPWYQPKTLEFPPHHSDRRISGQLVSADFIHRTGQFRMSKTGELADFKMPPYGAINYLNTEADLRDVPLGTFFLFFLNQDEDGKFTRLATMQDQFTMDASHSFTYRLDEAKLTDGKLLTTKHSIPKKQDDLGKKELIVTRETRVWKGDQRIKLEDLKPGDELLYNLTGKSGDNPGYCTDVWTGLDTHKQATEQQRKKFNEFTKARGLPGWIDKTDGSTITFTLFSGDTRNFKDTWLKEMPAGKAGKLCVANDELRTWNPPVDGETANVEEVKSAGQDGYGCSGTRLTVKVNNMLEGFRKGRVIRFFPYGWKTQDQFYGESLMGYGFGKMQNQELVENPAKEYPEQFPFRTEFSNPHLAWFQLKPGEIPPPFSEHVVWGELIRTDAAARTGQMRPDRSNETVDFTFLPEGTVKYLNAEATLADIPAGTRCRFHLYQDEKGAFTKASLVSDLFSHLAGNVVTWRIESIRADKGELRVAWQIPEGKDYNGDMKRPPDIARSEIRISKDTRLWKGEKRVEAVDLAVGDTILASMTGEQTGKPALCTDVWIGEDTHKAITEAQKKKFKPAAAAKNSKNGK